LKTDIPTYLEAVQPSRGYCRNCGSFHQLGMGSSYRSALQLMQLLEQHQNIDIFSENQSHASEFSTEPLFGDERGKMFGVLDCTDANGNTQTLYAFSGQFAGRYLVAGWVPPLFDVDAFWDLTDKTEKKIKELSRLIDGLPQNSAERTRLSRERRALSRSLMRDIHELYRLRNFRGESCSLAEAYYGGGGIPTGTGDCCAPKLLNHAARLGLRPLGLCEFFWGRSNKSGTMHHKMVASACAEKCGPILGFLLCGLEEGHE